MTRSICLTTLMVGLAVLFSAHPPLAACQSTNGSTTYHNSLHCKHFGKAEAGSGIDIYEKLSNSLLISCTVVRPVNPCLAISHLKRFCSATTMLSVQLSPGIFHDEDYSWHPWARVISSIKCPLSMPNAKKAVLYGQLEIDSEFRAQPISGGTASLRVAYDKFNINTSVKVKDINNAGYGQLYSIGARHTLPVPCTSTNPTVQLSVGCTAKACAANGPIAVEAFLYGTYGTAADQGTLPSDATKSAPLLFITPWAAMVGYRHCCAANNLSAFKERMCGFFLESQFCL